MDQIDNEKIEYIQNSIKELLTIAGYQSATVEYENSLTKGLIFNISMRDARQLIGRQGQVLIALEQILFSIINRHYKNYDSPIRFSIDIDEYRKKREWNLKQDVKKIVSHLKKGGDSYTLNAMPRNERKFIHNYIQDQFPHLKTESVGEEPNRKIKVII